MREMNLMYVRHNLNKAAYEMKAQTISFHDMTIVIKGRLEYIIDGKEVTLEDRDLIFIPKGARRERRATSEAVDYISFNFICERDVALPLFLPDAVHSTALLLLAAFDKINNIPYKDNKEKKEHLLCCLISMFEDRAGMLDFSPITLKIMEYIKSDLRRKITLEDIRQITFFSPVYCETVFKKDTGQSIIDYLIDERIEEAKRLLTEGALSLQQISDAVGFNDYNYFSRVFKRRSGYSPRSYKKMMFEG